MTMAMRHCDVRCRTDDAPQCELDLQMRSFIAEDLRYCDDVDSLCVLADSHDSATRPGFVTWPLSKIT